MRRHYLGSLVGLCMLGLAAPTWAVPMTDTLFGEITEVLDPANSLGLEIGLPVTLSATWDTDDFVSAAPAGLDGIFIVSLSDHADRSSLLITVGPYTWVATDDDLYGFNPSLGGFPSLIFDDDGDLLGTRFFGTNADNVFFGFDLGFLREGVPPGEFGLAPGPFDMETDALTVIGRFVIPGFDVPEPGTLALLGLGLLGLGVTRRRAN